MEVQRQKTLEAIENHDCGFYYEQSTDNFSKIPGSPVAYWASTTILSDFVCGKSLSFYAEPKQGMATMDNNKYLRMWYEIDKNSYYLHGHSLEEAKASEKKWFPYNKGGDYRKWYGNFNYLVNWENDGAALKADAAKIYGSYSKRIYNTQYFFLPSITWSKISSGTFSVRCIPDGCLFDVAGCSIFIDKEQFAQYVLNNDFLEVSEFNDWFYGTLKSELNPNKINIAVLNPEGVENILLHNDIEMKVFYVEVPGKTRLIRQLQREKYPDIPEIYRRYMADDEDFNYLPFDYEKLYNDNNVEFENSWRRVLDFARNWTDIDKK